MAINIEDPEHSYRLVFGAARRAASSDEKASSVATFRRAWLQGNVKRMALSTPEVMVKITSFSVTQSAIAANTKANREAVSAVKREIASKHKNPKDRAAAEKKALKALRLKPTTSPMAHLSYITRLKDKTIDDEDRVEAIDQTGSVRVDHLAGDAAERIKEYASELEQINESTGSTATRLTMNLLLSMPPGTNRERFTDAANDFLAGTFENHDYLVAFHNDRNHYHAHAVIPMLDIDGNRLRPEREDIAEWRAGFAKELESNGIRAKASPARSRQVRSAKHEREPGTWGHGQTIQEQLAEPVQRTIRAAWRVIVQDLSKEVDQETAEAVRTFAGRVNDQQRGDVHAR